MSKWEWRGELRPAEVGDVRCMAQASSAGRSRFKDMGLRLRGEVWLRLRGAWEMWPRGPCVWRLSDEGDEAERGRGGKGRPPSWGDCSVRWRLVPCRAPQSSPMPHREPPSSCGKRSSASP